MAKKYDTNNIPATFIMCKVAFFMRKKLNIRRMMGVLWIGKYGGADEIDVVCDKLSSEVVHRLKADPKCIGRDECRDSCLGWK